MLKIEAGDVIGTPEPGTDVPTIPARALYPANEAKAILGIKNTKFYELVKAGDLEIVKQGVRSYVSATSLNSYLASLSTPGGPIDA